MATRAKKLRRLRAKQKQSNKALLEHSSYIAKLIGPRKKLTKEEKKEETKKFWEEYRKEFNPGKSHKARDDWYKGSTPKKSMIY